MKDLKVKIEIGKIKWGWKVSFLKSGEGSDKKKIKKIYRQSRYESKQWEVFSLLMLYLKI